MTHLFDIESRPSSIDRTLYDSPASVMLSIRRRTKGEIAEFGSLSKGFLIRPPPGEDEAFDALQDVINGRTPALSYATGALIASSPARLGPLAHGMAKRFLDLIRDETVDFPGRREQAALLALGMSALNGQDFSTIQDQLSDLARSSAVRNIYPLLYLRLADAGPKSYSIYRDLFLGQNATQSDKLMAALAVCRIGQADSEFLSAVESEWAKSISAQPKDESYMSALFVTLAKLGQEDSLKSWSGAPSRALQTWYDAVMSGRGRTNIGPNNCMPIEWPGGEFVPPSMSPRLRWTQQQWRDAD